MENILGFTLIMFIVGGFVDKSYQNEKLINSVRSPKHEKCNYNNKF